MRNYQLEIEAAVAAGKLEPRALAIFAAHPQQAIAMLEKSESPALTKSDVQLRLEKALNDRQLPNGILGLFAIDPDKALSRVSAELKKSYGLPDRLSAVNDDSCLEKSQSSSAQKVLNRGDIQ